MKIFIPSRGRADICMLPDSPAQRLRSADTFVVVNEDQWEPYRNLGLNILMCPATNIGEKRQWIINQMAGSGEPYWQIDDDLPLEYVDIPYEGVKFNDCPRRPLDFETIESVTQVMLNSSPYGSIRSTKMWNAKMSNFPRPQPVAMMRAHLIDPSVINFLDCLDEWPIFEDIYMALLIYHHGYTQEVSNHLRYKDGLTNKNKVGGTWEYRKRTEEYEAGILKKWLDTITKMGYSESDFKIETDPELGIWFAKGFHEKRKKL